MVPVLKFLEEKYDWASLGQMSTPSLPNPGQGAGSRRTNMTPEVSDYVNEKQLRVGGNQYKTSTSFRRDYDK